MSVLTESDSGNGGPASSHRGRPRITAGLAVRAAMIALVVVYVLLALAGRVSDYQVFTLATIGVFAIAALGQDWLIGQAGQVSLGGAAFMAVGAFTVAGTQGTPLGSWPVQLGLAGFIGGVFGLIVGLPGLRVRGLYLLLSTLAFQFIMLFVTEQYQGDNVSGFTTARPTLGSWQIQSDRGMLLFTVIALVVVSAFSFSLQRSAPGRYWRSIRESELASASLGIDVVRWKLLAFVGSSVVTAMAGAMYAWVIGLVTFDSFSFQLALNLSIMVFVGGRGRISGPIIGAAAVTLLPQGLTSLSNSLPQTGGLGAWISTNEAIIASGLYGLALLAILLLEPQGLVGIFQRLERVTDRLQTRLRPQASAHPLKAATGAPSPSVPVAARPPERSTPRSESPSVGVLSVSNLSVRYPNGSLGAEDVSFTVPAGTIAAMIGRNGAGKTSTLRAVAGYPRAEKISVSGRIEINGEVARHHDPLRMRRRGVVLVPERDKTFPTLTVAEHIRLTGVSPDAIDRTFDRFPVLKPLRSRRAGYLSGGERQALALAVATAVEPQLLLIDEPSLGLSPVATQQLVAELIRIRSETGMTVLLTEQATETVESVADAIHVLDGGRVIFSGGAEDLHREDVRQAVMGT